MVTKCKHGIGTNDIITFNEELEFLSTLIIELLILMSLRIPKYYRGKLCNRR